MITTEAGRLEQVRSPPRTAPDPAPISTTAVATTDTTTTELPAVPAGKAPLPAVSTRPSRLTITTESTATEPAAVATAAPAQPAATEPAAVAAAAQSKEALREDRKLHEKTLKHAAA